MFRSVVCIFAILLLSVTCEDISFEWKTIPDFSFKTHLSAACDEQLLADYQGNVWMNENFTVVTRTEWGGRPPREIDYMPRRPVSILFIHHSAMAECYTLEECSREVRIIQDYHMITKGWADTGYNFIIGGDGRAYEGRGWDQVGAHTLGWNNISVSFGVMGDYTDHLPTEAALNAISDLMYRGVILRKLTPDFKLYGHRDARPMFESPGEKLYQLIRTLRHYDFNTPS